MLGGTGPDERLPPDPDAVTRPDRFALDEHEIELTLAEALHEVQREVSRDLERHIRVSAGEGGENA